MDILNIPTIGVILAILALLYFLAQRYFTVQKDAHEPPYITPTIPVIGHILGLIRNGSDYYSQLERRYGYGIYTLPVLSGRLYMVASPSWAVAVHRASRSLQFNTLIASAIKTLFCFDEPTMAVINANLNGENGTREGVMIEIHDMMVNVLMPGPHLDDLNKSILNKVMPDVNGLARGGAQRVQLWDWLRRHFSIASVSAIWGPRNPFTLRPEVERDFWTFEANTMPLSMMPYPQLFARKGYLAREKVFEAFQEYFDNERWKDPGTSELIRNRVEINMGKYGLSKTMHARGDASLLFGAIVNSVPTAFWLMSRIFEDPQLLVEIREEVDRCVSASPSDSKKRLVSVPKLRSACPLFSSAFRETMRIIASINSNRWVAEDTTVTNSTTGESYTLKKGSVVQIASNVIHFQPFWGNDVSSFNSRRFLSTGDKAKSESAADKPLDPAAPFRDQSGKMHSSAFRSFGGGNNICPGRYFAQTEILGLASLFIVGFEMETIGSNGYKMPPEESFKLSMGAVKPGKDVDVILRRRKGYEDVEWEFET